MEPAASGKGTLAKKLAKEFNYAYLDTGKLYRASALIIRKKRYKLSKRKRNNKCAKRLQFLLILILIMMH